MDFSGAQTLMGTFKTFAIYAGAVICFGGLIFAGIRMLSGRFQEAIPGLFGALFGAGVLGWGAGWIGSVRKRASRLRTSSEMPVTRTECVPFDVKSARLMTCISDLNAKARGKCLLLRIRACRSGR
jgi:hypothetical protein